jgi:hypothetical protein
MEHDKSLGSVHFDEELVGIGQGFKGCPQICKTLALGHSRGFPSLDRHSVNSATLFQVSRDGHSDAEGTWTSTALLAREAHKFGKYEGNYAALNLGFLALAVSTFCLIGPTFISFLSLLNDAKDTSFIEHS